MALRFMKGTLIYWHDLIPEVTKHLDGSFWMNGDFRLGTFGNAKSLSMTAPQKTAGFVDFCSLEYWQRTWIVQEVLLGSDVELMCGTERIPWHVLGLSMRYIQRSWDIFGLKADILKRVLDSTPYHFAVQRSTRQPASLGKLLSTYHTTYCADPRDKVYAMLGLASDCNGSSGLPADYGKSAEALFCDFVLFCEDIPPGRDFRFGDMLCVSLGIRSRTVFVTLRTSIIWR